MKIAELFQNLSIERKLQVVSAVPAIGLIVLSVLTYHSARLFEEAEERLARSYEINGTAEEYLRFIVDLETGFRGYVLTAQDRFLQPYSRAKGQVQLKGRQLAAMVEKEPDQVRTLQVVEGLVQVLIREKDDLIAKVRDGRAVDALHYIEGGRGRELMVAIRDGMTRFDQREFELITQARDTMARERAFMQGVIVGGGALALGVLALMVHWIARSITQPLASLAKTVGFTESGLIPQLPALDRQDEIGDLTRAMSRMREQIREHIAQLEKSEQDLRALYQDLSASEGKYRDLVNHAPLGIFTLRNMEVTFSNRYNQAMAGLDPDQERDPNLLWQVIHPDDRPRVLKELSEAISRGRTFESVFRFQLPNGAVRKILSRAIPIRDAAANVLLYQGFNVDITAREKTQERLSREHRLATLGQVAAGIAHEMRNPLVGMGSNLTEFLEDMAADDSRREDLVLVLNEIQRLDRIVNQVVEFARPRPLSIGPVAPVTFIHETIAMLRDLLAQRGVRVSYDLPETLPDLQADRDQLKQVLLNLVQNAIEAVGQEGKLEVMAKEESREDRDGLAIVIKDNGVGILGTDLPHVFEPFFTTGKRRGTGLGLALSRNIVEGHGGHVQLASELGKGTTALLWLPLSPHTASSDA